MSKKSVRVPEQSHLNFEVELIRFGGLNFGSIPPWQLDIEEIRRNVVLVMTALSPHEAHLGLIRR
jgi:hypothetical protein